MEQQHPNKNNYLKGLDGLRALAAMGVLISHVYKSQDKFGFSGTSSLYSAHSGVIVFFTLSGFLITYLLLQEKETHQSIDIRHFYLRRILRIWPLYFFYITLCLLLNQFVFHFELQNLGYLVLMALFLPNIVFNLNKYQPGTGPLWSIGIEEQFYLIWPWIIRKVTHLKRFIVIFLSGMLLFKGGAFLISEVLHNKLPKSIASTLGFDVMAIGGLFAIIYFENQKTNTILKYRYIIIALFTFHYAATFFITPMSSISYLKDSVLGILTSLFIITQISSVSKFQILETPLLKYIGKLSFGIYVYHSMVILFFQHIVTKAWGFQFNHVSQLVIATMITTIAVSYISFNTMERYFLNLKARYTKI